MIVCSCAVVTDKDIAAAVAAIYAADAYAVVTPGAVYHALGRRFVCQGCRPLVVASIERELRKRAHGVQPTDPTDKETGS